MAADLAIVRLDGAHQQPVHDPSTALLFASSGRDVLLTMVAGRELFRDGRVTTVDEEALRERMADIAQRLKGV
jgi:5-methylthioadenosine/S-adenosylhomocysteine deaminase